MKGPLAVLAVPTLIFAAAVAYADPWIGMIKSADGDVSIVRENRTMKAAPKMMLLEGDLVRTAAGKAALVLEDDTLISMGPGSRLVITRFMFRPREKKMSLVARLLQGTVSFLCGQIAKLAPGSVRIETPQATIGVRGSHVLVKVD